MLRTLIGVLFCLLVVSACTDLRFLDAEISEEALSAPSPELAPLADLPITPGNQEASADVPEELSRRAAELQRRAAQVP